MKKRKPAGLQPLVKVDGVIRFQENRIVRALLDQPGGLDLNEIAYRFCDDEYAEEHAQLAQLIGYSVSGFGDLSYVPEWMIEKADTAAAELAAGGIEG